METLTFQSSFVGHVASSARQQQQPFATLTTKSKRKRAPKTPRYVLSVKCMSYANVCSEKQGNKMAAKHTREKRKVYTEVLEKTCNEQAAMVSVMKAIQTEGFGTFAECYQFGSDVFAEFRQVASGLQHFAKAPKPSVLKRLAKMRKSIRAKQSLKGT